MWRTLVDYSFRKSVSLSTLRRYIKSGKVQHRLEEGRYLVWDAEPAPTAEALGPASGATAGTPEFAPSLRVRTADETQKIRMLENELRRAQEEIVELRLLVSLYESQTSSSSQGREKTIR